MRRTSSIGLINSSTSMTQPAQRQHTATSPMDNDNHGLRSEEDNCTSNSHSKVATISALREVKVKVISNALEALLLAVTCRMSARPSQHRAQPPGSTHAHTACSSHSAAQSHAGRRRTAANGTACRRRRGSQRRGCGTRAGTCGPSVRTT